MRGPDSDPLSPEIATALMAVDATLAGEPVDPDYAELAELALILRRERPRTSDAFTARLDERVERRFARPAPAVRGTGLRRLFSGSLAGLVAATAAVALVVVIAGSGGRGSSSGESSSSATAVPAATAASSSASAGGGHAAAVSPDLKRAAVPKAASGAVGTGSSGSSASSAGASSTSSAATSTSAGGSPVPSPVIPSGRQVVQSAQLQLSAAANRINDVAQQVFNVVGAEKGFVNSSNVTSGAGNANANAGAYFQLSIPSANLGATLTDLSRLRGARVVSRTDQTNDITAQVGGAGERLAEARALRRSLLKQLADATTTAQVDSVQARLRDANASIASDLSTLRGLQRQVAYSRISVNIEPAGAPAPVVHHSSGFGIGRAAHDAGRVLVIVAGVGLIVLAVLVPVGLVAAFVAWVGFAIRRRRREQSLDLV